jgi:hypothetical protein
MPAKIDRELLAALGRCKRCPSNADVSWQLTGEDARPTLLSLLRGFHELNCIDRVRFTFDFDLSSLFHIGPRPILEDCRRPHDECLLIAGPATRPPQRKAVTALVHATNDAADLIRVLGGTHRIPVSQGANRQCRP